MTKKELNHKIERIDEIAKDIFREAVGLVQESSDPEWMIIYLERIRCNVNELKRLTYEIQECVRTSD